LDIVYSSSDTVKELKTLVNQARASQPKAMTEKQFPANLSSITKAELLTRCGTYGIKTNPNSTCGELILKIKQHTSLTSEVKGTDVYGIGKHQGSTYRHIRTQYLEYCEWAKTTVEECGDSCHWELRRFTRYLSRPLSPEPIPMTPKVKKETTDLPSEIQEMRKQIQDLQERQRMGNKRGSATSSTEMQIDTDAANMESLEAVLRTIMQRLDNLEIATATKEEPKSPSDKK
jgi:hypothetical protein